MKPLLSVLDLTKSFYHKPILDALTFSVLEGETVACVGSNGAGKSTLLRVLAKISSPENGKVHLNGKNIISGKAKNRRGLYYCGHAPGLYPSLSALENLKLFSSFHGVNTDDETIQNILSEYELGSVCHTQVKVFSQGMIQRLKLAHIDLVNCFLLLIDEPFTGLDISGQSFVMSRFNHWKTTGKTILFVDHDLRRATDLASRVVVLKDGKFSIDESVENKQVMLETLEKLLN